MEYLGGAWLLLAGGAVALALHLRRRAAGGWRPATARQSAFIEDLLRERGVLLADALAGALSPAERAEAERRGGLSLAAASTVIDWLLARRRRPRDYPRG